MKYKLVNSKKYIFFIVLGLAIISIYIYSVFPPEDRLPDLPILQEADRYALHVSRYEWKKAKKYSTPENNRILDDTIKKRFDQIARDNGLKQLKFKSVSFEKSLLVAENPDHQIVAEKMVFDTPKKKDNVLYLRFEIVKSGHKYRISNTRLFEV